MMRSGDNSQKSRHSGSSASKEKTVEALVLSQPHEPCSEANWHRPIRRRSGWAAHCDSCGLGFASSIRMYPAYCS